MIVAIMNRYPDVKLDSQPSVIVVAIILMCTCLVLDLTFPLGVAAGVPYVSVVLICLRTPNYRLTVLFAAICSMLTVVGYFLSPDGGIFWVVLTNRILALFAIWIVAVLGILQQRSNSQLIEREVQFKFMADAAPLMIWRSDDKMNLDFFSKGWSNYTGSSADALLGGLWREKLFDDDRESVIDEFKLTAKTRDSFQKECRLLNKDGTYHWVLLHGEPRSKNPSDRRTGYIGTCLDIDQLKETERKLEDARAMYYHQEKLAAIGTMASGIIHEVGNPIASIHALADELLQQNSDDNFLNSEQVHMLDLIMDQVNRITQITHDVSDFTTIKDEQTELLDVNELVMRTHRILSYDRRIKELTLVTELGHNVPAFKGHADQLMQVLINLIINAADACSDTKDPRLRLSTKGPSQLNENSIEISVEDDGCGIASDVISRIEEPFFTTKGAGAGMGLGLSLSHTIITAHQGEMIIDSSEGVGTKVTLRLPTDVSPAGV